ncbi:MAG TPA: ParB/RepB/Spo0J family partition protein [Myxococcota bacterium]|jgi:ParB family chromosome partitioning protein|nr:ParB/RepB/Spo0J family partition protein [Myxococcota bacterium]
MSERKVLGRGLSALIPEPAGAGARGGRSGADRESGGATATATAAAAAAAAGAAAAARQRDYLLCPIADVRPNPAQPRKRFAEAALLELAESIREQGLIQPLVVRREGTGFTIIAGERRWRAAQKAGLLEVPLVVKDVSSAEAFEMALVENIQRADLDPIEEAEAYRRVQGERGLSTDEVARRVGKDRSTVANAMRLLGLPARVQELLATAQLSAGHGRALLGLEDARAIALLAQQAVDARLSVRAVERLVRQHKAATARGAAAAAGVAGVAAAASTDGQVQRLADDLTRRLGTRVRILHRGKAGRIEIDYHSLDELDRLLELVGPRD